MIGWVKDGPGSYHGESESGATFSIERIGSAWRLSIWMPDPESESPWKGAFVSLGDFWSVGSAKAAAEDRRHSGHEIEVVRFNAGRHPIHGWNWPMWGFRVSCSCGFVRSNAAGSTGRVVKSHLRNWDTTS